MSYELRDIQRVCHIIVLTTKSRILIIRRTETKELNATISMKRATILAMHYNQKHDQKKDSFDDPKKPKKNRFFLKFAKILKASILKLSLESALLLTQ